MTQGRKAQRLENKGAILKPTRREFAKLTSLAAAMIMAVMPNSLLMVLTGCSGTDAVIAALDVAKAVASAAGRILAPLNTKLAAILSAVSIDLGKVVDLYKQYESAVGDKPTIFQLIQATVSTITNNLAEILAAIHVFNPALQTIIKTAVAIANSAISFIISHLPQPHQSQARLQRLNLPALPSIDGAKSANDLKKAWNDAVKAEHPEAVIR